MPLPVLVRLGAAGEPGELARLVIIFRLLALSRSAMRRWLSVAAAAISASALSGSGIRAEP